MENLEQIIQSLLTEIERNPDVPIDQILTEAVKNIGGDENEADEIISLLNRINNTALDLATAKEGSLTRADWISERLEKTAIELGENSANYLADLDKAVNESLNNL